MRSDQLGVVGSNINEGVLFGSRGLFTIVEVDIVVSNKVADGHIIETALGQVVHLQIPQW
jgi:hypothetical protein